MNDVIRLEGTTEQVKYLREAIDHYKMVLLRLGGTGHVHIDNFVAERDEAMSYWTGSLNVAEQKNSK